MITSHINTVHMFFLQGANGVNGRPGSAGPAGNRVRMLDGFPHTPCLGSQDPLSYWLTPRAGCLRAQKTKLTQNLKQNFLQFCSKLGNNSSEILSGSISSFSS